MSHENQHSFNSGNSGNSGGPLDAETLHRYHDGELPAAERAAVEARLPGDPEAQLRLAALDELATLLRATSDAETEGFDAWQAVEKKLAAAPQGQGNIRGIETARRRRRFGPAFWAGISSVAAAAAVVIVLLQPWHKAEAADNTVEIGEVDTAAGMVSVMQVPAEGQGATTVLWLQED